MGRILALDFGELRTGIAVTDELKTIASGLSTVPTKELMEFLENYTQREDVEVFVVGEPRQMNNSPSAIENSIQKFVNALGHRFPKIPVTRQDERFTSKMAFQTLLDGGMKKKKRRNKALLDEISATLILQAYLNRK